jgi:polyhydroxybutyrate depolymerase
MFFLLNCRKQKQPYMNKFYFYLTIFFCLQLSFSFAQSTSHTLQHDGLSRGYLLYVPASYDSTQATALVFNFHGYGSNNAQQEFYGDFRPIADTANFILVHPNGTIDPLSNRYWNVGFFSSNVDDVGFIEALIDELSSQYNINPRKIYATGMSNGGFMSYRLACETNRFAAIASVTGSMTSLINDNCNPTYPTPIMQIHGDADSTVPYAGLSDINSLGIDSVMDYWSGLNNCFNIPTTMFFPDNDPTDGVIALRKIFPLCDNGTELELIKVLGGGHTWPGAPINTGVTCQDFSASEEIWHFFRKYERPVLANTELIAAQEELVKIYPNPSSGLINIETEKEIELIEVFNLQGQRLSTHQFNWQLDLSQLPKGSYIIRLTGNDQVISKRINKF